MAPPRKRNGPTTAFTYRCETPKWRKFCAVATLLGRSPGSFFDETVDSVLVKNRITIDFDDERLLEVQDNDDGFYNLTNLRRLDHSIEQLRQGKVVEKTMEELERMADE